MSKSVGKTPKTIKIKVVPSKDIISERIYSNYVQVSHSPMDFTLSFCDAPSITEDTHERATKTGTIKVPVQVEVVMAAALVESLIKALTEQHAKYKAMMADATNEKE